MKKSEKYYLETYSYLELCIKLCFFYFVIFFFQTDMLTSAFGSSKKRKAMETRLRHQVEKYVLEGALNSAVDTGLVQAETHKAREGKHMSVSPEHRNCCSLLLFF